MRYDMVTGGCDRYDTDAAIGEWCSRPGPARRTNSTATT
jgi:hypothetical protein